MALRNLLLFWGFFFCFFFKSLLVSCPTHTNPASSGLGTGGIHFDKRISKSKQLYLLHNLAGSNTQHVFFICIWVYIYIYVFIYLFLVFGFSFVGLLLVKGWRLGCWTLPHLFGGCGAAG